MKLRSAAWVAALVTTSACAADSGFYAGIDAGSARAGNPDPTSTATASSKAVAGIFGGYQIDKNWSVEAKYTGAGEVDTLNATGGFANAKADSLGLSGIGTLPLSDGFSLYGKLGYARTKTSLNASDGTSGTTRSAPTYGLGVLYDVKPNIGVRLGWDRFGAADVSAAGATQNFNSNVYTVGVLYRFGS